MRKLVKLAVLMVLLVPAAASAQLSLGARLGYSLPMGDAVEDGALKDGIKGQIPIQIDVGYKLMPALKLGGYFAAGYGFAGDEISDVCDLDGVDCSFRVYRAGLQLTYDFAKVSATFVPWVGAGIGYEWGSIKVEAGGDEATESYRGFEFLNLQAGGDWKVGGNMSVGPFVMFSIAQYSNYKFEEPGLSESGSIDNKGIHEWLQIGIRGTLDI